MLRDKELRRGDLVRVRSAREILATLDDDGMVEGIPFMPEMIAHLDRRFRVSKRIEKICWYTPESSSRRLSNTVLLEDLRCDGTAHGGCQAECRIYWKDDWIERVDASAPEQRSDAESVEELRVFVTAGTRALKSFDTGPEEVFRCQITESLHASKPVPDSGWWQYTGEFRNGNVGLARFLRVVLRLNVWRIAHRLGRHPDMPKFAGANRVDGEKLGLEAGELVEVRSLDEIGATLTDDARHRGLRYSEELTPACGKRFRVKNRVERLIDENTGRMIELKNDCIVLEGFVCSGDRSFGSVLCPREAYPLFREAWLRRVDERKTALARARASGDRRPAAVAAAESRADAQD
jgi:hypothetical protein